MIFNGFPGGSLTDEEATQFLIDEPVKGSMESYPLIQAIFENESYVEKYHEYLGILCDGYLDADNLNDKVLSVYDMIKSYVKDDPTSFYTYEEFENGLFQEDGTQYGLLNFVEKRVKNVSQQLSGEIASTNNGEGNVGSSMGSGMKGQTDVGNTQRTAKNTVIGQVASDSVAGDVSSDIAAGQAPSDVAAEQQVTSDMATGQAAVVDIQQVATDDTTAEISTNSLTELDNTDIIVLLVLSGILFAIGLYLKIKH